MQIISSNLFCDTSVNALKQAIILWVDAGCVYRKDRYNLAKIEYLPFLLHSSNPGSTLIIDHPTFVPQFNEPGSHSVGGEVI